MQRLLTAAVLLPLALAAVFFLPPAPFLICLLVAVEWAAFEYLRLTRRWAPQAPLAGLLLLVPAAIVALAPEAWGGVGAASRGAEALLVAGIVLAVGIPTLVLLGRTPVHEALPAIGILTFGVPYFVVPALSIFRLWSLDVAVLVLLLAMVWVGDTAAYYCGKRWGRRRLAPTVSPKKSWEGAAASLAAAVAVAAVWSQWRLGAVEPVLLAVGAGTSVAAQVGDLVESMIKRAAHVKDSGTLLPGHGGVLDRIDALLFAAPVLWLGLRLTGLGDALP